MDTTNPTTTDRATDAAPDWNAIAEAPLCPLCSYDLRGLVEPRCPECGYRFAWPEILDPARRLHPFLFEHHPERNWRSFWRTLWAGWRPRRFWTGLHPAQPSRPRRLILYWLLTVSIVIVPVAYYVGQIAVAMNQWTSLERQWAVTRWNSQRVSQERRDYIQQKYGAFTSYLDREYPTGIGVTLKQLFTSRWASGMVVALVPVAWPWVTFLALLVFQTSMHRARIAPVHVLRCVLYSSDSAFWVSLASLLAVFLHGRLITTAWVNLMPAVVLGSTALFVAMATGRLVSAYQWYLRFERPQATVVLSQIVALLALFNAVLAFILRAGFFE